MNGRSASTTITLDLTMQQVTADGDDVPVRATLRYDVVGPVRGPRHVLRRVRSPGDLGVRP